MSQHTFLGALLVSPWSLTLLAGGAVIWGLSVLARVRSPALRIILPSLWGISGVLLLSSPTLFPEFSHDLENELLSLIFVVEVVILFVGGFISVALVARNRNRVVATLFLLMAIMLPTGLFFISTGPMEGRKYKCLNNERNVGLAVLNYFVKHQQLPPRTSGDPPVSWRVEILDYLDQSSLNERFDRSASWDAASNTFASKINIRVLRCPSMPEPQPDAPVTTAFAIPYGDRGIYNRSGVRKLNKIPDGTSNTLLIVEAARQQIVWTEPRDVNFDQLPIGINLPGKVPGTSNGVFSSDHVQFVSVIFADGSGRFLARKTDPKVLQRLLQADDGAPDSKSF